MSSSSLPLPPGGIGSRRTSGSGSSSSSVTAGLYGRASSVSSSSLPPPPNVTPTKGPNNNGANNTLGTTNYGQALARSMTIEEMRALHRRALGEAEAKQMELRLVLASRYRELVGSSDEVTKMRERAQELHQLVGALPELMEKLIATSSSSSSDAAGMSLEDQDDDEKKEGEAKTQDVSIEIIELRRKLSQLPRLVHRALDRDNVHDATQSLIELLALIAQQTDEYPLATTLSKSSKASQPFDDTLLEAQMRMTFLHVQTLPLKIVKIAKQILHTAATADGKDPNLGAETSAAALSALDLLEIRDEPKDRATELLELYFDAKATLLQDLLGQLHTTPAHATFKEDDGAKNATTTLSTATNNAEEILSKIVLILQYDIILHPYQIFVLRNFPGTNPASIMKSLPMFPAAIVQARASKFLSAHLPLIRTKVKSVLVEIAGTTASALGQIRQSLYDKTDGVECRERLDNNGVCTWDEAVGSVVDVQNVLHNSSHGAGGPMAFVESTSTNAVLDRKFSLWAVLFSNTFSSLVHSLLTSSFQSVHTKVVSTLRLSLAHAPSLNSILPHEAYRNTLYIASELDAALIKVSDDAHELLVHAEEREESESRLRQSLYVQTCEIMGRLICELRRMLLISDSYDAVKHLIVGRLCHLLKFRLTVLPTLLDPNSSPAVLLTTTGMISLMELSSAFELADDNEDGLITFQEAMEAVDSAFSGTQFHGAELVRETLLLPTSDSDLSLKVSIATDTVTPQDVTLNELTLLLARGLRHEASGKNSALGTIQESLDDMMSTCFDKWAQEVLKPSRLTLSTQVQRFMSVACNSSEQEYQRLHTSSDMLASSSTSNSPVVSNVSPHVVAFLQEISFTLNRSICPSDSLLPVPSVEYAISMGVEGTQIPRVIDLIRWALLTQGLEASVAVLKEHVGPSLQAGASPAMKDSGPSAIAQLKNDISFLHTCFFTRNQHGFGKGGTEEGAKADLEKITKTLDILVRRVCDTTTLRDIEEKHKYVLEVCELFFSSLFGEDISTSVPLGDIGGSYGATPHSGVTPLFQPPLQSSCRFPLLPIQADRTLSGVQARGKYKEKEDSDQRSETIGGGAMRAGLGFFSNMLKKG
ncbi:Vps51/Vps67 vacuolar sorting complex protein [Nitzschia inconspicua]|uniref:Conserved oligomeric Golgi complex subunit 1 n=1 Tax=Nitzschia inconspicua TaxID=303405 RepID=A0A9K3K8C2_9STRA|nr:Vps51/Vps67 vacuolar sorting complex protein [Nitzschia inconspicua]